LSWLDLFKRNPVQPLIEPAPVERLEISLLSLGAVLFPGGVMSLKLSDARYFDMVAERQRDGMPFGICLANGRNDDAEKVTPHEVGVLAHIMASNREQGALGLTVRGGRRFRVLSQSPGLNGILRAQVELLVESARSEVPEALRGLLPLLHKVVGDLGVEKIPEPHHFDDAAWVGYRLTEVVPVQLLAKQKLLELDDPASRLEILHAYFSQRQLLI
jgi:hypothetical protein